MQKIVIFGDSYAVSGYTEKFNFQKTWADLLAEEFEIENFAETGCGPDLQLQKFINYFTQDRNNDIVIFVLPHHLRISLNGLKPVEQVFSFLYLHNKVKGISQKVKDRLNSIKWKEQNKSYQQYVNKYGVFLDLWYEYFLKSNTYLETEPLKIAALISKYEKLCKKIILLPIHPISEKDKFILQGNNFLIANLTLRLLDEDENVNLEEIKENGGIDKRAGHLNEKNHRVVYTHLKELIDGKIYS